jgi:hypothetical protein
MKIRKKKKKKKKKERSDERVRGEAGGGGGGERLNFRILIKYILCFLLKYLVNQVLWQRRVIESIDGRIGK